MESIGNVYHSYTKDELKKEERNRRKEDQKQNDRKQQRRYADPYKFHIPNGYGMAVTIQSPEHTSPKLLDNLLQHGVSQEDIPFYCLKRFYMKTICNMVDDIVDIAYYSGNIEYMEDVSMKDQFLNAKRQDVERILFDRSDLILKAFTAFEASADRKSMGAILEPLEDREVQHSLTCEGNVITWVIHKKKGAPKHSIDKEYTVIEKTKFNTFVDWLLRYAESPIYRLTAHQWAAIKYLEAVRNGRLLKR